MRLFDAPQGKRECDPRRHFFMAVEEAIDIIHHMPDYIPPPMRAA